MRFSLGPACSRRVLGTWERFQSKHRTSFAPLHSERGAYNVSAYTAQGVASAPSHLPPCLALAGWGNLSPAPGVSVQKGVQQPRLLRSAAAVLAPLERRRREGLHEGVAVTHPRLLCPSGIASCLCAPPPCSGADQGALPPFYGEGEGHPARAHRLSSAVQRRDPKYPAPPVTADTCPWRVASLAMLACAPAPPHSALQPGASADVVLAAAPGIPERSSDYFLLSTEQIVVFTE